MRIVCASLCYRFYTSDSWTRKDVANLLVDKDIHKVLIIWELTHERIEWEGEDKPRVISKEYSLSLHKKSTLRKDLESWRGISFSDQELEGFNLDKILGANAMINVIHKTKDDRTYANVAGISPLMKNMQKIKPENEVFGWSFDNDGPTQLPEDTPEWIKKKIEASLEWQAYIDKPTGQYEPETSDPNTETGDPGYQVEDDSDPIPF